jgi:hypothetical protein
MTPPDTDLKNQSRRHRPALYAMAFVVIFGFLTLLVRAFYATDPDTTPVEDPTLRAPLVEEGSLDGDGLPRVPDTE